MNDFSYNMDNSQDLIDGTWLLQESNLTIQQNQISSDLRILRQLRVPVPTGELDRLDILRQCNILDTAPDADYDRIVAMTARILKVPIAVISLIDVSRQWVKSHFGLDLKEQHRDQCFCSYAILETSPSVMVVPDLKLDHRFEQNPLVQPINGKGLRFYASVSLVVEGMKVGTLSILDTQPRVDFAVESEAMLAEMGSIVANMIAERRSKAVCLVKDKAEVYLNVLSLIRHPLKELSLINSNLQALRTQVNLRNRSPDEAELELRHDLGRSLTRFSNQLHSFHELLELSLSVTSRLLNISGCSPSFHWLPENNSNNNNNMLTPGSSVAPSKTGSDADFDRPHGHKGRFLEMNLSDLERRAKRSIAKSHVSCPLDLQVNSKLACSQKTPTWKHIDDDRPMARRLADSETGQNSTCRTLSFDQFSELSGPFRLFSHPDVASLLLNSLLSLFSRQGQYVSRVALIVSETDELMDLTSSQVRSLVGYDRQSQHPSVSSASSSADSSDSLPLVHNCKCWQQYLFSILLHVKSGSCSSLSSEGDDMDMDLELATARRILMWIGGDLIVRTRSSNASSSSITSNERVFEFILPGIAPIQQVLSKWCTSSMLIPEALSKPPMISECSLDLERPILAESNSRSSSSKSSPGKRNMLIPPSILSFFDSFWSKGLARSSSSSKVVPVAQSIGDDTEERELLTKRLR